MACVTCPECGYRPPDDHEYYSFVNQLEDELSKLKGRAVRFTPQQRDLLAILGTGRRLHRDSIIQKLWLQDEPEEPVKCLRLQMHKIRAALQGSDYRIGTHWGEGYQLLKPPQRA